MLSFCKLSNIFKFSLGVLAVAKNLKTVFEGACKNRVIFTSTEDCFYSQGRRTNAFLQSFFFCVIVNFDLLLVLLAVAKFKELGFCM